LLTSFAGLIIPEDIMKNNFVERREASRAIFTMDHQVMGRISISEKPVRSFVVQILNMSTSGIFFTFRSNRDLNIKSGDIIFYEKIRAGDSDSIVLNIKARIVWMEDDPSSSYVGVGSKFLNDNPEIYKKINNFINLNIQN
jgi:c-di-GMP-binding flagellar brake protein YcgR